METTNFIIRNNLTVAQNARIRVATYPIEEVDRVMRGRKRFPFGIHGEQLFGESFGSRVPQILRPNRLLDALAQQMMGQVQHKYELVQLSTPSPKLRQPRADGSGTNIIPIYQAVDGAQHLLVGTVFTGQMQPDRFLEREQIEGDTVLQQAVVDAMASFMELTGLNELGEGVVCESRPAGPDFILMRGSML